MTNVCVIFQTYVYPSKSPLLIASINCSVIFIISCRLAALLIDNFLFRLFRV